MKLALFDTSTEILTLLRLMFLKEFEFFSFENLSVVEDMLQGKQKFDGLLYYLSEDRLSQLKTLKPFKESVLIYADKQGLLLEASEQGFPRTLLKPFSPSVFENHIRSLCPFKKEPILENTEVKVEKSENRALLLEVDDRKTIYHVEHLVRQWLHKQAPLLVKEVIREELIQMVQEADR